MVFTGALELQVLHVFARFEICSFPTFPQPLDIDMLDVLKKCSLSCLSFIGQTVFSELRRPECGCLRSIAL